MMSHKVSLAHRLAYHAMATEGNWPGQRHRFFRNLGLQEWATLYGRDYIYSSDYIHAHRRAFSASTRCLARTANLLEEAGEIMQRTTTWHMRLTGSVLPATLRDLGGKGRFCYRLRRALQKNAPQADWLVLMTGERLDSLFEALLKAKLINTRGQLMCDLQSPDVQEALAKIISTCGIRIDCEGLAGSHLSALGQNAPAALPAIVAALRQADARQHWTALSARKKAAYVAGCICSTGTQLGITTLLLLASGSVLATVVGKTLAAAGILYGLSGILRIVTTLLARGFRTHRGLGDAVNTLEAGGRPPAYRSLSENLLQSTRAARNAIYTALGVRIQRQHAKTIDVDGLRIDIREYRSSVYQDLVRGTHTGSPLSRRLAEAAVLQQCVTDVVYAGDSMLSRLTGRAIRLAFCSQGDFVQIAGHTANRLCAYDWQTRRADQACLGKWRLSFARLLGVGGADTLGACAACLAVSAFWTALTKVSGGFATVAVINGAEVVVPLASATAGAVGWSSSLLTEGAMRLLNRPCARSISADGTSAGMDDTQREEGRQLLRHGVL